MKLIVKYPVNDCLTIDGVTPNSTNHGQRGGKFDDRKSRGDVVSPEAKKPTCVYVST
jgi:hypothetical protein